MSKTPQTSHLPKDLTRKQISRAERDARNTRLLLLAVGGAVLVSLLVIGFAALRDAVFLPNEPVIIVGEQSILTREFQQRVRLERFQLINLYSQYQQFGLQDNADQIAAELQSASSIGSQVINTLIEEALFRQAAPELGVTVAADEVQKTIEESFDYFRVPPTPVPTRTPLPTPTTSPTSTLTPQPTFTPQPTATPVTAEGFQSMYQEQLRVMAGLGLSEADYRRLVETQLIAQQVRDVLGRDVVTMTEQALFQYIGAGAQADIDAVQQAIGEGDFDGVYQQVLSQTFPITSLIASVSSYTPREDLIEQASFGQRFADAVFSTPISGTFGVITSTSGSFYFVGRVLNREVRELAPDALERRRSAAVRDWLNARNTEPNVRVLTWEDRVPVDPALTSR
jgi:hypothetical protein